MEPLPNSNPKLDESRDKLIFEEGKLIEGGIHKNNHKDELKRSKANEVEKMQIDMESHIQKIKDNDVSNLNKKLIYGYFEVTFGSL